MTAPIPEGGHVSAPLERAALVEEVVAWALLAIALAPLAAGLVRVWSGPTAEHGPVVVAMASWLAWRDRGALRGAPWAPRPWLGGGLLLVALWLFVALRLDGVATIATPCALLAIAALVLARYGPAVLRRIAFPLTLCLFALPAPGPLVWSISIWLKLLAARLACTALQLFDVAVVQVGSTIHLSGARLEVDEACSGLRGLTAIAAFALVQWHLAADRRRGALALLVAVPAAVVANALRVTALCALVQRGHTAALDGPLHDGTGVAVYAVALAVVYLVAGAARPPLEPPEGAGTAVRRPLDRRARTALACVLLVGASSATPLPVTPTAVARQLPATVGSWTSTSIPLDASVRLVLGDDVIARRFVSDPAPDRPPLDVFVVHAADDPWRPYHPPDACFQGEGFSLAESGAAVPLPGTSCRADRRLYERDRHRLLVYFWFRLDGAEVLGPRDLRLRLLFKGMSGRRRVDATFVRVSTSADDGLDHAEARIGEFMTEAFGPFEAALRPLGARD